MNISDSFTGPPVWTLERRGGVLIAGQRRYKGTDFFEIRLWVDEGSTATNKGVTMPPDAVAGLAEALAAYAAKLPDK